MSLKMVRSSSVVQSNDNECNNVETTSIYPISNGGSDVGDVPSNTGCVTNWDIFFLCFSIFTHIVDVGFDLNLATRYLIDDKMTYFAWTVAFILFPTLVNTVISIRMHYQDHEMNSENSLSGKCGDGSATRMAVQRKMCCVLILLFQLAPVLRYIDSLKYALKARKCKKLGDQAGQKQYYFKMLREDQDVALLRVFECFLEAAPQQILQVTILLRDDDGKFSFKLLHQVGSVCSSLVSMGWAMASYHRNIRLAQRDKPNIGIIGTILQFLWHFCVTVSRILSVSVVASVWPLYTGLGCILHWIVMTTWLVAKPYGVTEFCRNRSHAPHIPLSFRERAGSTLFALVLGIIYIFTYLNPTEGRTFLRHLFYYVLCLLENVAASMLWAFASSTLVKARWYFKLLVALCTVPFLFGIAAMILYYMFFHPSTKHKVSSRVPPEPS